MNPQINQKQKNGNWLFIYIANSTFLVFFSRLAEIVPFLGKLHVNLFLFSLTFCFFFASGAYAALSWKKNEAVTLIVFFLFVGLATIPFAVWPGNAFAHWKESLLVNNTIIIFFCFAAIHNEKQLMRMVQTFLFSVVILVTALVFNPKTTFNGRPYVTDSYDANDLALIFAVSFPIFFSQFWAMKKKGKFVLAVFMCLTILAVLKTGSRGGLLALLVGLISLLFSPKIKLKILYKFFVIVLFGIFLLSPQAEQITQRWATVLSGEDYNLSNTEDHGGGRLAIWSSGLVLFGEHFMSGVGVGNSSTAMGERYGNTAWMTMHNSYIQVALELGVLGLMLFLSMLLAVWRNCTVALEKTRNVAQRKQLFIFATSLRISLIVFIVGAFFLSQAYSIIIPFYLIISNRLRFLAVQHYRREM